jgi:hypothetical protein
MRVLIGVTEIANFVSEFTAALRDGGIAADSLVLEPNTFYAANDYTYRYALSRARSGLWSKTRRRFAKSTAGACFLLRLVRRYDVFVFVWNATFLPLMLDLPLLRLLGKRVIVFNCGDDVRYRPIQNRIERKVFGIERFDPAGRRDYERDRASNWIFLRCFFTQRVEEWSGCRIVTTRNQATFQKNPAFVFRFPVKRLLQRARTARNERPLIIHAPTDRAVKGTACVLAAVERLREQGLAFDFELIEGRDNAYVLSRLVEADVVIDQPGTWIGRLGAEALAASCAVVGGNLHEFEAYPEPSPVLDFPPDAAELASRLGRLIRDSSYRGHLMARSFDYWQKNYSYERFVAFFRDVLAGTAVTLPPLPAARQHLLACACNGFQRAIIRVFF